MQKPRQVNRQLWSDLLYVFGMMPWMCLLHLRSNRHRLVRGVYRAKNGRGCLFFLLTELLPAERRIDSRATLTRFFGGDPHAPEYAPAKWIVRLWDGMVCEEVRQRYGNDIQTLDEDLVFEALEEAIRQRESEAVVRPPEPAVLVRAASSSKSRSVVSL